MTLDTALPVELPAGGPVPVGDLLTHDGTHLLFLRHLA